MIVYSINGVGKIEQILDYPLPHTQEINPKWIKDLNVVLETIKILEKAKSSKISDIPYSLIFYDICLQATETKEKINKRVYIKLKVFSQQRKPPTK